MTTKGLPLGGIACPVSCLYFDDYNTLSSFLQLPGNTQLGRRVIQVQHVNHNKTPRTVWAVMVGAARYVEHFSGKLKAPNCVLQFNPSKGFNAGSMNLVVSQRNGVGIAPQYPTSSELRRRLWH